MLEAVEEAIDVARAHEVHVEIVHLKCSGVDNWGKAATHSGDDRGGAGRGPRVDCDAYPYAAGANPLEELAAAMGPGRRHRGDAGAPRRAARRAERIAPRSPRRAQQLGPHPVLGLRADLDLAASAADAGKTVAAIAAARGCDPIDQLCDHLIADNGATRVLITSIAEDDIRDIVRSPDRARRLRRQLRRRLRDVRPGHAAPALLRHLPAHHRPLCAATSACCRSKRRCTR